MLTVIRASLRSANPSKVHSPAFIPNHLGRIAFPFLSSETQHKGRKSQAPLVRTQENLSPWIYIFDPPCFFFLITLDFGIYEPPLWNSSRLLLFSLPAISCPGPFFFSFYVFVFHWGCYAGHVRASPPRSAVSPHHSFFLLFLTRGKLGPPLLFLAIFPFDGGFP